MMEKKLVKMMNISTMLNLWKTIKSMNQMKKEKVKVKVKIKLVKSSWNKLITQITSNLKEKVRKKEKQMQMEKAKINILRFY